MAERPEVVDHYGAQYREFAGDVYAEVRRAAFGEDIGQNSWLTVDELYAIHGARFDSNRMLKKLAERLS